MNRLAWKIIETTGAFRVAHALTRDRLIALTYHQVLPDSSRRAGPRAPNVTFVSEFEQQVSYLARHHHLANEEDLSNFLCGAPLPPHSVLITFDDGYRNNYTQAFPVLRRMGASALFFLATGFVGNRRNRLWFDRLDAAVAARPDETARWLRESGPLASVGISDLKAAAKRLSSVRRDALVAELERVTGHKNAEGLEPARVEPMTWSEVREMAAAGMHIGAHTETHQILAAASLDEAFEELRRSRATIEAELDRACWAFSYPNGEKSDFGPRDFATLRKVGYRCAFTQGPGAIDREHNPYALPRVPVPAADVFQAFQSRATGLHQLLTHATAS
jgi:peptidoglycan/xylan/chitin deacetylase (PgdA/CDA1 family)